MALPVRIEAKAWTDPRYQALAIELGMARARHALIAVADIWQWQTEHYTNEKPTYCVPRAVIVGALESKLGPEAMVAAGLAEAMDDGTFRIRGGFDDRGKSRIDWYWRDQQQRRGAGAASADRRKKAGDPRTPDGRLAPLDQREANGAPTAPQREPERDSERRPSSLISGLCSDQISLSREPDAPPTVVRTIQSEASAPSSPSEAIGPLLEHAVDALNAARRAIDPAAEPIHPMEIHTPAGAGLRDRLRAVVPPADRRRKLDLAIAVLSARATAAGVVDDLRLGYLGGEKSWSQLLAGSVKGAARVGAGPPRVRPAPRGQHNPDTINPFPDGEQPI